MRISELYLAVIKLVEASGDAPLNEYEGCWEKSIDDFDISVNGHDTPVKDSHGFNVRPYNVVITHNGWPVASLAPNQGEIIGGAEVENELIAIVQNAEEP